MSRVIPFKAEHVALIDMREIERAHMENDPYTQAKFHAIEDAHDGVTVLHDGRILAFMGVLKLWPGVFEVWVYPSKYITQYPVQYLRIVKHYLNGVEMMHPHRIQTNAVADETHDRWMRFLGFEKEGELKAYTSDGQDYRSWAKVFPKEAV